VSAPFPRFRRRAPAAWYRDWHSGVNDTFRIILLYHREARNEARGSAREPLPMVFSDDEILALAHQIGRAKKMYGDFIGRPGAHSEATIAAAEAAWLVIQRMYGRIPTLLRERKRKP
jgi:hypothetical protein